MLEGRERRHPDVIALERQVAGVEDQLLQLALSYQDNLQTSINSLDDRLATFGAQLQLIPQKAVQQARLERRKRSLEEVYDLLQARLKEAEIAQAVELGDVGISDLAVDPREPIRPRKFRSLVLSILFGLTLGLAVATARDYLDETLHTREDLGRITGLPVLALIPRIQGINGNGRRLLRKDKPVRERLVTRDDISNPVSEAYRAFRTNITFLDLERPAQLLVFTSPGPAEGKSTSAANLAITLAQQGTNALLMDCDLRRGILHRVFGADKTPGLTNVVLGEAELSEALHSVDVGEGRTLDFLPTGTLPPNPSELLGSTRMRELLRQLRDRYGQILMDSPPLKRRDRRRRAGNAGGRRHPDRAGRRHRSRGHGTARSPPIESIRRSSSGIAVSQTSRGHRSPRANAAIRCEPGRRSDAVDRRAPAPMHEPKQRAEHVLGTPQRRVLPFARWCGL